MIAIDILRAGKPVAHVIAATTSKNTAGGKTNFDFADGSAWLEGTLVGHGVPAKDLVGIAFTKASLSVPGSLALDPGGKSLTLPAGAVARFAFVPAQPKPPAGSLHDDGAEALADFPAEIAFDLDPAAIKLTKLGDASLKVYGQGIDLTGGAGAATFDSGAREWIIRFAAASAGTLSCEAPKSATFLTSGDPAIHSGVYAFPVTSAPAAALAFENAHGWLGLSLPRGLSAQWGNLAQPVLLSKTLLRARNGEIALSAISAVRPFADAYSLWNTSDEDPKATSIRLVAERGSLVRSAQSAVRDAVKVQGCAIEAHLDQPFLADGSLPQLDRLKATYIVGQLADGLRLTVEAVPDPTLKGGLVMGFGETYVIENALLRCTGVQRLTLKADLVDGRARAGQLRLFTDLRALTPTLPHPYAASFAKSESVERKLRVQVAWPNPKAPVLSFRIAANADGKGKDQPPAERLPDDRQPLSLATFAQRERDAFDVLLDVSGAGDQLGVIFLPEALNEASIDRQTLFIDGQLSALFAVPQISWEAVIEETAIGDRHIFPAFAADDGPPAMVNVATQSLRPMTPRGFIAQFLADYEKGADLWASFTLPFGLEAMLTTQEKESPAGRPKFGLAQPKFSTQLGGLQLAFVADAKGPKLVLPGGSYTTKDAADSGYPKEILDTPAPHLATVAEWWNDEFRDGQPDGPYVPVRRFDLSGYGASSFSDFAQDIGTGISEVRFDVIVGRTAYTLIQLQSNLLPWMVPVVNTTIFERDGAAWIERRNTGWRAKGPGIFAFDPPVAIEAGGVTGVFNVRNILDTGGPIVTAKGGKKYAPVYFDTDVGIVTDLAKSGFTIKGGDIGGGLLAGKGFIGYLGLTIQGPKPSLQDAIDLMDVVKTASGPVGADVEVAKTGIRVTLTGVDVAATPPGGTRTLGVALRGLPHLPRDGSWSVAKRESGQPTPSPVDPLTPVPFVRHHSDLTLWHMADPGDVLQLDNPANLYGLLQSTGTQKLFFEHATVANKAGQAPLNCKQPPKIADIGSLLGSSGLLPTIASLLDFPSFKGFNPSGDGLATASDLTNTLHIDDKTLIPLGPISVVLSTNDNPEFQPAGGPANNSVITAVIDPTKTPHWSVTITNVAFKLLVDGMGSSDDPLIAVIGDVSAAEGKSPGLANVQFAYGSSLSIVKDVLSGISALAQALPGGNASGLDVSFAGTKLRVRDVITLPTLPLGFGYIEDIGLSLGFDVDVLALDMSFYVGVGSPQQPFAWLASPLAGNGFIALGADKQLGVVMQGGIGVGLGIDLAIASGSASVVLAVRLDTTKVPFGVMVLLTGNASVDVLDGLASASLTLTAGLGVQVSPGPPEDLLKIPPDMIDFINKTSITLSAEVDVAIHLSICWVVHIDWSGEWGFSETLNGSSLTSLLP
jgi:hypothetical protein